MANQEQLDVLKQGTTTWNAWRAQNQQISIDLSGANLVAANLSGADLSGANLSVYLSGANLVAANLSGANLSGANLSYADLSHADLSYADLIAADFSGADLSGANLSGANLRVYLSRANLNGADFNGANLIAANLSRANLNGTNLSRANLSGADFSRANLSRAYLNDTNLSRANLSYANLSGTNLSGTTLNGTNLSYTRVYETIFNDLNLRFVKGLETIQHGGPSGITTSTLERSEGNIPDIFLKGAGLSDTFLTYARSLVQSPIQYYTCFLSYSSKDELFARRLHNDLQQEGIRCWFAPEDLDIGDKIRQRIEESIRLYDKLLLVLSKHSIASMWVAYEVEKALNKEPKGTPNVLYPVRVDQTILSCKEPWAQEIKETRHIGNFEQWTEPEQYQENFKRLLRALNVKEEHKR